MADPLCPQGHPLGVEPECVEPHCAARRIIYCLNPRAWDDDQLAGVIHILKQVRDAAIEPLEARVRELGAQAERDEQAVRELHDEHDRLREALAAKDAELARVRAALPARNKNADLPTVREHLHRIHYAEGWNDCASQILAALNPETPTED